METKPLPILPITMVGSYSIPSWLWLTRKSLLNNELGDLDVKEAFDDALRIAVYDQENAGIDIITDGEMRRQNFTSGFYELLTGIKPNPINRKLGVPLQDQVITYNVFQKILAPKGLGIIESFKKIKKETKKQIKVTCPGPLTLSNHLNPTEEYNDIKEIEHDLSKIINDELRELVSLGAEFIQIDEPSYTMQNATRQKEWTELLNKTISGINSKIALHICFGNRYGRPVTSDRSYEKLFPQILDANVDQFVLEFANRQMSEIDIWKRKNIDRELGAGIIDVKSATPENINQIINRINLILKYVKPDNLYLNPDCGFWETPRWLAIEKMSNMVQAVKHIRSKL